MDSTGFVTAIGSTYEHSPWVAERAFAARPFASIESLVKATSAAVRNAPRDEQLALIRAHPDLVGKMALASLTLESQGEQHAAGLTTLTADEAATFQKHNAAYRERFGFPFVICARENKKDAILAAFPKRLTNNIDQEVATALAEIDKIAALRLADALWDESSHR